MVEINYDLDISKEDINRIVIDKIRYQFGKLLYNELKKESEEIIKRIIEPLQDSLEAYIKSKYNIETLKNEIEIDLRVIFLSKKDGGSE